MKKSTFNLLLLFISNVFAQSPQSILPTSDYDGTSFGRDVAVFNDKMVVSSANSPMQIGGSGKVFIFKITNGIVAQTSVFYPTDALVTDNFGVSIAFENDLIAIGAPNHDANFENSGAVYVYKRTNESWQLLQKISAADGAVNDNFGTFVKIHNNQLFISATNDDAVSDSQQNEGAIYVYTLNETSYSFLQKITTPNSLQFGSKIEAENNKMVILSRDNATNGIFLATYTFNGTNWIQQNVTPTLGTLEQTIHDFSLSNNTLFLLASTLDQNGTINIFDDVNNTWTTTSQIGLMQFPDQIYTKIKVAAETMLLGSTAYILQNERKFPVLIYKKINASWTYQNPVYGLGLDGQDDYFGASLALSNNFAVVGAPGEGAPFSIGKAYYFDSTLDLNTFEKNTIQVYPNPSSDLVFLKNNSIHTIQSFELFSVTGTLLVTEKLNLEHISLLNYPAGMYFIKLRFDDTLTATYKILKK